MDELSYGNIPDNEDLARFFQEIFNPAGEYPWKELIEDQVVRIENQFDRRHAMIGM